MKSLFGSDRHILVDPSIRDKSTLVFMRAQGRKMKEAMHFCPFLAPTGAQGVTLSVRPSGASLSRAVNLHMFRSESIKIRVIQSEPKILRLVSKKTAIVVPESGTFFSYLLN